MFDDDIVPQASDFAESFKDNPPTVTVSYTVHFLKLYNIMLLDTIMSTSACIISIQ